MRPRLLVPLHLANADPSFFVVAGIIFTVCSEPYLLSEYGMDYMSEAPVKLLERLMHGERTKGDEQVQQAPIESGPVLFAGEYSKLCVACQNMHVPGTCGHELDLVVIVVVFQAALSSAPVLALAHAHFLPKVLQYIACCHAVIMMVALNSPFCAF